MEKLNLLKLDNIKRCACQFRDFEPKNCSTNFLEYKKSQNCHLNINEIKLMKTNQSYESLALTTSKEEVGVKSVGMHEIDKLEQKFRGCYPVQCVQIRIYKPVRDSMSK